MELIKADDSVVPICPFCEEELNEVMAKQFEKGFFKKERHMYLCPKCKKVLGIVESI